MVINILYTIKIIFNIKEHKNMNKKKYIQLNQEKLKRKIIINLLIDNNNII